MAGGRGKVSGGDKARKEDCIMGKTACIHSWREDPAVSGGQKLVPVTCRGVIESLEGLVVALHRDSKLDPEQDRLLRDISAREQ